MSNSRKFRRRRPRPTNEQVDTLVRVSSVARGCTCTPDVATRHTDYGAETVVAHDDDCPAADTGSAFGVAPGPHSTPEGVASVIAELMRLTDP